MTFLELQPAVKQIVFVPTTRLSGVAMHENRLARVKVRGRRVGALGDEMYVL